MTGKNARRDPASRTGVAVSAAALLLLCLAFGIKVWRATFESTIWMDEVFSLQIIGKSTAEVIDDSLLDFHPPLYYLALREWLETGGALGVGPSILFARSLNLSVWLLLLGVVFFALHGRASLTRVGIGIALLALSPGVVQLTQDALSHGFALLGITLAFLAIHLDLDSTAASTRSRQLTWAMYAASASFACWSHNLSWLALAAMMTTWLAAKLTLRPRTPLSFVLPAVANVLVVACAAPWLMALPSQLTSLASAGPSWMTPPSVGNFLRVFVLWLPLGRDAQGMITDHPWLWFPVAMAWGSLVLVGLKLRPRSFRLLASPPIAAIVSAIGFVLLLWSGSRWLGVSIFHGPRYPLFVSGTWALGIWGLAMGGQRKAHLHPWDRFLAASWLVCGALSLTLTTMQERRAGEEIQTALAPGRGAGRTAFFAPKELEPFFRRTLRSVSAVPLPQALCSGEAVPAGDLLYLNRWRGLDASGSLLFRSALQQGVLGAYDQSPVPPATQDFELIRFRDDSWTERYVEHVCPALDRLESSKRTAASGIEADLTGQLRRDGWSYLEFDGDLRPFRWTTRRSTALRFRGPLTSGSHALVLAGHLRDGGRLGVSVEVVGFREEMDLASGPFEIFVPFDVAVPSPSDFVVQLETEPRRQGEESRYLGALIRRAQIHRVEEPPPRP
jgi:hypothetical protein